MCQTRRCKAVEVVTGRGVSHAYMRRPCKAVEMVTGRGVSHAYRHRPSHTVEKPKTKFKKQWVRKSPTVHGGDLPLERLESDQYRSFAPLPEDIQVGPRKVLLVEPDWLWLCEPLLCPSHVEDPMLVEVSLTRVGPSTRLRTRGRSMVRGRIHRFLLAGHRWISRPWKQSVFTIPLATRLLQGSTPWSPMQTRRLLRQSQHRSSTL
jgi:hypothetical protein